MDEKFKPDENYDFIYEDYLESENGDVDDLIFAPLKEEKTHSEK